MNIDYNAKCELPYIPNYLHWDNKEINPNFFHEEKLFWRCRPEKAENPYKTISLAEVSVNRSGNKDNFYSKPDDVFWDTTNSENERYEDFIALQLAVKKVDFDKNPEKVVTAYNSNNDLLKAILALVHDPLPCNYSHCLIRVILEGDIITLDNYKKKFGKKSLKRLRQACKDEVSKMIIRREIDFDE